jgi:hypothetical protein
MAMGIVEAIATATIVSYCYRSACGRYSRVCDTNDQCSADPAVPTYRFLVRQTAVTKNEMER